MSSLGTVTGRYLASYLPCTGPARSGIQGMRRRGVGAIENNRLKFMIARIGWTAEPTKYMDLYTWKTKVVPLIGNLVSDPSYS